MEETLEIMADPDLMASLRESDAVIARGEEGFTLTEIEEAFSSKSRSGARGATANSEQAPSFQGVYAAVRDHRTESKEEWMCQAGPFGMGLPLGSESGSVTGSRGGSP
jgi:hypothetical protein